MRNQEGLDTHRIAASRSFVVYDEGTGEIVHRHDLLVLEGAAAPDDGQLEETILASAAAAREAPARLAVLPLGDRELDPKVRYFVDVESRALVEAPSDLRGVPRADRGGGVATLPRGAGD